MGHGPGPRIYEASHGALRRGPAALAADVAAGWVLARVATPSGFDRAVSRLKGDPWRAGFVTTSALALFGEALALTIRPDAVERRLPDFVDDGQGPAWIGRSFLDAADWSGALMPAFQCHVFEEMAELVAADLDFRATRSYRKAKKAAQHGRPYLRSGRPLATQDDLKAYFRRNIDLVKSVRDHGLVDRATQVRLGFGRASHGRARLVRQETVERDVGVAVDADGTLVRHLGGRHRWGAVRALGLSEAAVEVRLVHVAWLARISAETGLKPHLALQVGLQGLAARA